MNYRKSLQILMMAVLLVAIGVLSAEAQESASTADFQQGQALPEQIKACYQVRDYVHAERFGSQKPAMAEKVVSAATSTSVIHFNQPTDLKRNHYFTRSFITGIARFLFSMIGATAYADETTPLCAAMPVNSITQLYQKAIELQQAGQQEQAITAFTQIIKQDPQHVNA